MKIIIYAVILAILVTAFGLPHHPELNKRVIVNIVGLDRKDDKWELTILHKESTPSGGEKGEEKALVKTSTGVTLGEAAQQIETNLGRPLCFGQTGVIVLGKSVLEFGIGKTIDEYVETLSRHPLELVTGTGGTAAEIVEALTKNPDNENIENMLDNAEKSGVNRAPEVLELQNHLDNDAAYIPCVKVKTEDEKQDKQSNVGKTEKSELKSGNAKEGEDNSKSGGGSGNENESKPVSVVFDGGILVKPDKFLSKVSDTSALGFHILVCKGSEYSVNTEYGGRTIRIDLTSASVTIRPYYGKFYVNFKAQARLGERSINTDIMLQKPDIEAAANEVIISVIQAAADEMKRNEADVAFLNIAARHYGVWDGTIENMPIVVSSDIKLREFK